MPAMPSPYPALFALAALAAAPACSDDPGPLGIRYELSQSEAQTCPSASCADIAVTCDAVLQVRIINPSRPDQAYVSACLPIDDPEDLCAIARGDLPANLQVPTSTVEVQVAVFPRSMATVDDDGTLRCPAPPAYGADGLPTLVEPVPAVGGRAFVDGSRDEVVVTLGCTDLSRLDNDSCRPQDSTDVSAGVDEFDTRVFVSIATAETLALSVGEPVPRIDPLSGQLRYSLDPASAAPLLLRPDSPVPAWQATVPRLFSAFACVQALEDAPGATTAIACRPVTAAQPTISITGYRVTRARVDATLDALGLAEFPATGMVLGVVVNSLGNPIAGVEVQPEVGTIAYLDDAGTAVSGLGVTSASGLFVSLDVPFATSWSVAGPGQLVSPPTGGLVNGKLSVVVIELNEDA